MGCCESSEKKRERPHGRSRRGDDTNSDASPASDAGGSLAASARAPAKAPAVRVCAVAVGGADTGTDRITAVGSAFVCCSAAQVTSLTELAAPGASAAAMLPAESPFYSPLPALLTMLGEWPARQPVTGAVFIAPKRVTVQSLLPYTNLVKTYRVTPFAALKMRKLRSDFGIVEPPSSAAADGAAGCNERAEYLLSQVTGRRSLSGSLRYHNVSDGETLYIVPWHRRVPLTVRSAAAGDASRDVVLAVPEGCGVSEAFARHGTAVPVRFAADPGGVCLLNSSAVAVAGEAAGFLVAGDVREQGASTLHEGFRVPGLTRVAVAEALAIPEDSFWLRELPRPAPGGGGGGMGASPHARLVLAGLPVRVVLVGGGGDGDGQAGDETSSMQVYPGSTHAENVRKAVLATNAFPAADVARSSFSLRLGDAAVEELTWRVVASLRAAGDTEAVLTVTVVPRRLDVVIPHQGKEEVEVGYWESSDALWSKMVQATALDQTCKMLNASLDGVRIVQDASYRAAAAAAAASGSERLSVEVVLPLKTRVVNARAGWGREVVTVHPHWTPGMVEEATGVADTTFAELAESTEVQSVEDKEVAVKVCLAKDVVDAALVCVAPGATLEAALVQEYSLDASKVKVYQVGGRGEELLSKTQLEYAQLDDAVSYVARVAT